MFKKLRTNPSLLFNNPSLIQEYYLYLKTTLVCDKSLHLIENDIFSHFYTEYFVRHKSDYLLNTKIILYKERLELSHLNIKNNINYNFDLISSMGQSKCPSDILEIYLQFIKNNNKEEHDSLLNILVYCIIKSNIKDFKLLVKYMKSYRRKIFINCEHKMSHNESEIEYYINLLEIALEFIERMEYKDLNISKEEYEILIGLE